MKLDIFVFSCWVNAALSVAMAVFVILSRPITRLKAYWALSSITVAGWSVSIVFLVTSSTSSAALVNARFMNFFCILVPTAFLHTVWTYLEIRRPKVLITVWSVTTLLASLTATDLLSTVSVMPPFNYYNHQKPLYVILLAHFYGLFAAAEVSLWKALGRAVEPRRRAQTRLLLIGIGLGVVGAQTTVPMSYGVDMFPYGVLLIPIYIVAVGWGMLRHQMLDFRLTVRRFSLVSIIYLVAGCVLLPIGGSILHGSDLSQDALVPAVVTMSLLLTLFLVSGPAVYLAVLGQSARLRSFMSDGFSHDLRSPLASIQSAAEIISHMAKSPSPDRHRISDYSSMIERNARVLDDFSTSMLALIKRDGGIALELSAVSVMEVIQEVLDGVKPVLESHNLKAELSLQAGLNVMANKTGLRSIIQNLVGNAIRHSENGSIRISAHRADSEAVISVSDDGDGLPDSVGTHLFDRLVQSGRRPGDAGLGLAITRNWVEAHGGRIWAESAGEGKGTMVTFTVPVRQ